MIVIGQTDQRLRITSDATATTNEPNYLATFLQATAEAWGNGLAYNYGSLTGTTAKEIIGSPGSGNQNICKSIHVHNKDTVDHVLTVDIYSTTGPSVLATIYTGTVPAGETLTYTANGEWQVSSSSSSSAATVDPAKCDARLSVSSSDPFAEASAATTLYWLPCGGNLVSVWSGSAWVSRELSDSGLSVTLSGLTASKVYDVWAYDNSGSLALETLVWTDDTTRATALASTDGVVHKSGDQTRRYLGSFRLDASKQIVHEGASGKLSLWNEYHRTTQAAYVLDGTNSWTYSTAAWRQARASSANQVDVMIGRSVEAIHAHVQVLAFHNSGGASAAAGIGIDSTTTNVAQQRGQGVSVSDTLSMQADYTGRPAEGYRQVTWLEYGASAGTTTWVGDAGNVYLSSGLRVETRQ